MELRFEKPSFWSSVLLVMPKVSFLYDLRHESKVIFAGNALVKFQCMLELDYCRM